MTTQRTCVWLLLFGAACGCGSGSESIGARRAALESSDDGGATDGGSSASSDGGSSGSSDGAVDACVPACADRSCGDDGCGGTCGSCVEGDSCDGNGQCQLPLVGRGTIETGIEAFTRAGHSIAISSATATFSLVGSAVSSCPPPSVIGACRVSVCNPGSQLPPAIPPARSAGVVTVSGANVPITLTPDHNDVYSSFSAMSQLAWPGDNTLTLIAAGADVPPFQLSAVAPSLVTLAAPATPGSQLTIDRSRDLTMSWSGGRNGTVELTLSSHTPSTLVDIACDAPAGAGRMVVPQAVLATLLAAPTSRTWTLSTIDNVQQQVGVYELTWFLSSFGAGTDGNLAGGKLVY